MIGGRGGVEPWTINGVCASLDSTLLLMPNLPSMPIDRCTLLHVGPWNGWKLRSTSLRMAGLREPPNRRGLPGTRPAPFAGTSRDGDREDGSRRRLTLLCTGDTSVGLAPTMATAASAFRTPP